MEFEIHTQHLNMGQSKKIWDLRFSQTAYGESSTVGEGASDPGNGIPIVERANKEIYRAHCMWHITGFGVKL